MESFTIGFKVEINRKFIKDFSTKSKSLFSFFAVAHNESLRNNHPFSQFLFFSTFYHFK
jgi:hypothetical protein